MGKVRLIYHLFSGRTFERIYEIPYKFADKEEEESLARWYAKEYCMHLDGATDEKFIVAYRSDILDKDAFIINAREIAFIEIYDLSRGQEDQQSETDGIHV